MYDASVVIPTYNRSNLLELTLASLLRQDLRDFKYEIVIIDDGSVDDTKLIVDKYSKLLDIKYLYHEHNGIALSKTRNEGIQAAEGNIIIFVDSGVVAGKNLIYEHCATNNRHGGCAVIGSVYALYAPTEDECFKQLFDITDIEKSLTHLRNNESYIDIRFICYSLFNFDLSKAPAPWHFFWAGNASVPRRILTGSVMFDESLEGWGMEDVDLGLRIFKTGLPFVLNKNAEIIHVPHTSCTEFNAKNESNKNNTIHFHENHKCIESEICYCFNDLNMNMYIKQLLETDRFDFNTIKANGLFNFLNNKTKVIIGGYNGSILKYLSGAHVVEYSKEYYSHLLTMLPKDTVYNFLGAFTPIQIEFDIVLITDFWGIINELWLYHILKEALRLGKTVYLLYEIIVGNIKPMLIEDEKMEGFKRCVSELNKEFFIEEYNADNVILRVLVIKR